MRSRQVDQFGGGGLIGGTERLLAGQQGRNRLFDAVCAVAAKVVEDLVDQLARLVVLALRGHHFGEPGTGLDQPSPAAQLLVSLEEHATIVLLGFGQLAGGAVDPGEGGQRGGELVAQARRRGQRNGLFGVFPSGSCLTLRRDHLGELF